MVKAVFALIVLEVLETNRCNVLIKFSFKNIHLILTFSLVYYKDYEAFYEAVENEELDVFLKRENSEVTI